MERCPVCAEDADLQLSGFSLWVLGRQFPGCDDYWDGNWLNVRARVDVEGAVVEVQGAFLRAPELASFADELEVLDHTLAGEACLRCLEPELHIAIRCGTLGQATAVVMITPDHLTQSHSFTFFIDQTDFSRLSSQCRKLLSCWPIKGNAKGGI